MELWLSEISHYIALSIEAAAILVVAIGSVEAFFNVSRAMLLPGAVATAPRVIWLRYARWLIAALTFQLAADIVHTAIAPTWDELGRLGAIAVIRTFLAYFLGRDIETVRGERDDETV